MDEETIRRKITLKKQYIMICQESMKGHYKSLEHLEGEIRRTEQEIEYLGIELKEAA